jgi:DNA-directed RNA polymerase II subunit RPB9
MSNLETNPLQFCSTCGFMLKPRGVYTKASAQEEYGSNKSGLVNFCNKCNKVASDDQKEVNSPVVYNNVILKDSSASLAVFSNDLINDPTLMSTKGGGKACTKCGAKDAVFFMSHSQKKGQEMSLVFICKKCQHKWLGGISSE